MCVLVDPNEADTCAITQIKNLAPLPLQGQSPKVSPGQGCPAASPPVDEVAPCGSQGCDVTVATKLQKYLTAPKMKGKVLQSKPNMSVLLAQCCPWKNLTWGPPPGAEVLLLWLKPHTEKQPKLAFLNLPFKSCSLFLTKKEIHLKTSN